ncbi:MULTISPECIES: hypothetical protein [Oceanithermus]|uniref:Uncharacterized protein n=2 Tax=Oceanithermus desulfurans TaxID=227924 RepID=A0A511RJ67_9DEIN|nr:MULTISPECIES: hypothetical protein [Oceanithermus]MBB6029617.1 small neutral amino acid transporter SnatA (MarC family) [Oceanithermus desulfurans]GEM89688.1 hypothetical protein ODE01S_11220 [Oceanithermus desulfurans NBRC 100063]
MNALDRYTLEDLLEWIVIGLLIVVGVLVALWLAGWVMVFLGKLFLAVAALIVALLKFLIPALIIAGVLYLILRALSKPQTAA